MGSKIINVRSLKRKAQAPRRVRKPISYERQAFAKLKPEFDAMVGKVAERMREAAKEGRPLTVDGAALHVVSEAGSSKPATSAGTDGASAHHVDVTIKQDPVVGIAPPVITFVEYGDCVFMFTGAGQKFSMETGTYASVARAIEQIEATGAIKIAVQNLRHLQARSSAH